MSHNHDAIKQKFPGIHLDGNRLSIAKQALDNRLKWHAIDDMARFRQLEGNQLVLSQPRRIVFSLDESDWESIYHRFNDLYHRLVDPIDWSALP